MSWFEMTLGGALCIPSRSERMDSTCRFDHRPSPLSPGGAVIEDKTLSSVSDPTPWSSARELIEAPSTGKPPNTLSRTARALVTSGSSSTGSGAAPSDIPPASSKSPKSPKSSSSSSVPPATGGCPAELLGFSSSTKGAAGASKLPKSPKSSSSSSSLLTSALSPEAEGCAAASLGFSTCSRAAAPSAICSSFSFIFLTEASAAVSVVGLSLKEPKSPKSSSSVTPPFISSCVTLSPSSFSDISASISLGVSIVSSGPALSLKEPKSPKSSSPALVSPIPAASSPFSFVSTFFTSSF
mmetsp:Transcript_17204/g.49824  ORF Transcript_17204/g.49824 Transcript_17204/m.49824 type:complete len:297 (+) Transcript_17204:841-1731(+)